MALQVVQQIPTQFLHFVVNCYNVRQHAAQHVQVLLRSCWLTVSSWRWGLCKYQDIISPLQLNSYSYRYFCFYFKGNLDFCTICSCCYCVCRCLGWPTPTEQRVNYQCVSPVKYSDSVVSGALVLNFCNPTQSTGYVVVVLRTCV